MSDEAVLKRKRETRSLDSLLPYPDQGRFFDEFPEHELETLAEDIRQNGLKHPIEVLPANKAGLSPNTILCGHQRLRALQFLGYAEYPVMVRHDLAKASREELDGIFLGDNFHRRQLDPLAKARVAVRLLEIEKGRDRATLRPQDDPEARDRVGKLLGMSGRNLERYLRVLDTPTEVQDAFRRKELSLVDAAKVARLEKRDRNEIVRRLRSLEPVKQVVAPFLTPAVSKTKPLPAFEQFFGALKAGSRALEGREDRICVQELAMGLAVLERAHELLDRLITRGKQAL